MNTKLWDIYKKFVYIGTILIGGGYVILPILKKEVIENKNWITEEELIDYYAISQSLPGLIAANISIFIGYKLKGVIGAFIATLGIITTPFISICILSSIISQIANYPTFKAILWGISIGVIILVLSSIKELWNQAIIDKFAFFMFVCFVIGILKFNISPSTIILVSILIGILYKFITSNKEDNK